jgi:hypothetical protein
MSSIALRPPLPSPLSHVDIPFVIDLGAVGAERLSDHLVVAIASCLQALLPEGDLSTDATGALVQHRTHTPYRDVPTLWHQAGLLEGIERSSL